MAQYDLMNCRITTTFPRFILVIDKMDQTNYITLKYDPKQYYKVQKVLYKETLLSKINLAIPFFDKALITLREGPNKE